ncbi:autotransporter domain-containing protein [Luteibacter aegosomatissinici]|uniref:autotransporter domain-containing protein n=1 Tax=Luteibacter aegosomatissinici TaxID=2911539 RepID=UPI001FFB51AC|nr:autotransporter domain-containing protein [Luteibacter aegosomatissinici]UPG93877.1 autotransporter domain-containing protein [Luteibacter aegosomatissinici]
METMSRDRRPASRTGKSFSGLRFVALCLLLFGFSKSAWAVCTSPQSATIGQGGSATFSCADYGFSSPAIANPSHGSLLFDEPTLIYNNSGDGSSSDTFTVTDDNGQNIVFNITITGGSPPTGTSNSVIVAYGSTNNNLPLTVTGSPTSVTITSAPSHGSASTSGASILYTPTAGYGGADQVTYTATNASGTSLPATVSITVAAPVITYAPANPPDGTFAVAYSQSIAGASGGTAPYTYAVTSGQLPSGIVLDPNTGVLSGTPSAAGTASFSVTASDHSTGGGPYHSAAKALTLTVNGPTITLSPATVPNGTVHAAYPSTSLTASGGTSPYNFSVPTNQLPPGLTLTTGGVLSGTPTTAGTYSFTVTATDANSSTGTQAYSVTIAAVAPQAPTIGTATAGAAGSGQAQVAFTPPSDDGGSPITTYTAVSTPGNLTATASGSPITITGLSAGNNYSFKVTAKNSAGTSPESGASNSVQMLAAQTITFNNPGSLQYGTSETLTASASSGLSVQFSTSSAGVCTITSGGALTLVGAGNCIINANQAGDTTYAAAPQVTQTFAVTAVLPGAPTIGTATAADTQATVSFTPPASNGGAPITEYIATSNPGGITGTSSGSPVTVPGLTNGVPYTFKVVARNSQGTGGESAASNSVTPIASQTITFNNPGPQNFGTTPAMVATATSGLQVTFTSGTQSVCTVTTGGQLTTISPGNCTIHADQAGNSSFTPAPQVTQTFQIVVPGGAVSFATPSPLPTATGGSAYSLTLSSSGGAAPYSYNLIAGTFPLGMTPSSAGTIAGTPITAGVFNFTMRVIDAASQTATKTYQLTVNAPAVALTPSTLPQGKVAVAYATTTLTASGGTAPYHFAVSTGTLPPGLVLAPSGVVSGTPTVPGAFNVTVTATDYNGFQGAQAYSVAVGQAVPIVVNGSTSVPANGAVTIPVASQGGPVTSVTVSQAPAHGTAVVNGLNIVYTPTHDYFGSDTLQYTATGPGGTSAPASVAITVVPGAVPTASAQAATLLAGKSVTIHAVANATNGPFTTAAVVTPPTSGTAVVQGTDIVYTAAADASGSLGFDYTVSNVFGASQPAHVALTVNPMPVAPSLAGTVVAGNSVAVNLTATAHGGPFTAAKVVSIAPSNAGAASIQSTADGYVLSFNAAPAFGGSAQIMYTLSNAYAESTPGTVTVTVTPRSDPSKDPEVLGVLDAQAEAARRMATGQISNFQRRLETLHSGGGASGFSNGLTVSSASNSRRLQGMNGPDGADPLYRVDTTGNARFLVQPDATPTPAADGRSAGGSLPGDIAVWTGGAINFGKMQAGTSDNGIDFTTSGVSMGVDKAFSSTFAAGLGVGYGHDRSDVGEHNSRSSVDAYNAVLYGSYHPADSVYVDGLLGYQWLDYDARRYVTDDGGTVHGSRDGKQWFGSISVGYQHQADDMTLTPYGRLDVARAQLEGYTESGDSVYALTYQGQTVKTATGTLGLLAQWTARRDYGVWSPQLRAEFGHDMQGSSTATMRYADSLQGPLYQATLASQSRNHTMVGVGVALQTLKGWLLRMEYQNYLDNTSKDNQSILLGIEKKFDP